MLSFHDILGHDRIKEHLQNAIRMDKVSHAYILCGEDGSGKNMLADVFSTTLQCEEQGIEPCGKCKACIQASTGNHPDIIHVTHEKSRIGVDEIREQLNNSIMIKPYSGKRKIYIIDDAEKMTEQAQNALLKTVEEPPEYAVILLLTNNRMALLQTILSRCVALELRPIDNEIVKQHLMEKHQVPDYIADISAAFSGGVIGRAVQFATSPDFIELKDKTVQFLKECTTANTSDLLDTLKFMNENNKQVDNFLDLMKLWFRDVLLFKATRNANSVLFSSELTDIIKLADNMSFEKLNDIQEAFDKAKVRLQANVNFELVMELLLLTCQNQ